jgi:hypothetical protein
MATNAIFLGAMIHILRLNCHLDPIVWASVSVESLLEDDLTGYHLFNLDLKSRMSMNNKRIDKKSSPVARMRFGNL